MSFCFTLALTCFWLNLMVQFTSEFSLSCTDLCKVSTGYSDHVISYMVVFIAEIEGNCFYIIFSIYLSGAGLTCSMLACRLLTILVCMTRRLYI